MTSKTVRELAVTCRTAVTSNVPRPVIANRSLALTSCRADRHDMRRPLVDLAARDSRRRRRRCGSIRHATAVPAVHDVVAPPPESLVAVARRTLPDSESASHCSPRSAVGSAVEERGDRHQRVGLYLRRMIFSPLVRSVPRPRTSPDTCPTLSSSATPCTRSAKRSTARPSGRRGEDQLGSYPWSYVTATF
jgi:hypothetical protein